MRDTRMKNVNWRLESNADGTTSWEAVHTALLMDIRDELQKLNVTLDRVHAAVSSTHAILACKNFLGLPATLRRVARNTAPPQSKVKTKKKAA